MPSKKPNMLKCFPTIEARAKVTAPTASGWLTVFPWSQFTLGFTPTVSSLNYAPGQTVANLVMVKPGDNGTITFTPSSGCPNVIVDVVGYSSEAA